MTEQWEFDTDMNDGSGVQDNTPKGLRTWAASVQRKNNDLEAMVAAMQKQLAETRISSVFEDLGVPKSAAALYKGDADPEAIKSWVTDVRSAFGIGNQTDNQPAGDGLPPVQNVSPTLTPDQLSQYQQLTAAGGDGRPSTGIEDSARQVNQANSVQELIDAFQKIR